ncbi:hypothetical protein [Muricomes intestini]|jgi:hypothetical protein|uniref:hypothetical protein n=1 Tax=Muricomes intestini TaxID=1796634 RepID=UPI002FDD5195
MNELRITVENGKASVFTPYNSGFVSRIKGIGGAKWNPSNKCWTIPEDAIEVARGIMREVYGAADNDVAETVKVKVTALNLITKDLAPIELMGKVLSSARGRDSGAKPGNDVAYISGKPSSGGSAKNWESTISEGAVIVLSNVNKNLYEKYMETPDTNYKVELVKESHSKNALLKEKEQLLARLKEIEAELNK